MNKGEGAQGYVLWNVFKFGENFSDFRIDG